MRQLALDGGGGSILGGDIVIGSAGGQYATPFGDSTQYVNVLGGTSATITLTALATGFGLLWGSVDSYNLIQFLDASNNVIASFGGNDILPGNNGYQGLGGTAYVNFLIDSPFKYVIVSSDSNSFEFDDVALSSVVPVPAALPLLLTGLGGLGWMARRRAKSA